MRQAYRSALVTGASSGIGESIARSLARRGCDLVLVARRTDLLQRLAEELRERYRIKVEVLVADLVDVEQRASVEARLAEPERPIELLVNNAGVGTSGLFARLPLEREQAEIDLNVVALVRLTHAALAGMLERGHGGILNVSSMAGFTPAPGGVTYNATKAYVTAFSESLHAEVRGAGVHVTALCPGFTRTGFQNISGTNTTGIPDFAWLDRDEVARAGLEAVSAGRALCVPGLPYKALMPALRLTPRALLREASARVWQQRRRGGRRPGRQ
jgi:short-subunit dehydrogenase